MYEHLRLVREEPINQRRNPPRGFGVPPPDDLPGHCHRLIGQIREERGRTPDIGGYDQRRLLRLSITSTQAINLLERIPGLEFVSQEADDVILAFADEAALNVFEERLILLASGGSPTYRQLLYAIESVHALPPEERQGWALRREGMPENGLLDVELLPFQDRLMEQTDTSFQTWLAESDIALLDRLIRPGLMLYRVRCDRVQMAQLLRHRDVRLVDLPPRFGLAPQTMLTGIQQFPPHAAPAPNAPRIAILDSGIQSNHPLLASAVGDARSFCEGEWVDDRAGHGTFVAGLALYGDIDATLNAGMFNPRLWLLSGRILDARNEFDTHLIEAQLSEAVRAFHEEYGCRIFNLSVGDRNRPYDGRHLRGLAYVIDSLSRELGVLFVVSTGNFVDPGDPQFHWRDGYPGYLLSDQARLIDPAPALNAITVGSIARYDASHQSQRHSDTLEDVPIATADMPSPFTRTGPSIGGAIKPDFVACGGNYAHNPRNGTNHITARGIGTLSFSAQGGGGPLFAEDSGTSFAAPQVTHLAGKLLAEMPGASANLLRALLAVNGRERRQWRESAALLDYRLDCFGYGVIDDEILFRSTDDSVTLYTEERLANNACHFYEIPVPTALLEGGRRRREITVALSHLPAMRTTRIDYKATQIEFRLVQSEDFERVCSTFQADSDLENISELTGASVAATLRAKGTLQCARWVMQRPSQQRLMKRFFLVVIRKDRPWGEALADEYESYALAIQVRDAENENAQHYVAIRQALDVKLQQRQRAQL